jgi:hypothetical protein
MSIRSKLILWSVLLLIAALLLFHFGPLGIRAGDDCILSSTVLTNGSRLFLVAHRTGHPIDAYEVSLFRVDQNTNVFVSWLGYEDGYWWGGALLPEWSGDKVKIQVFGGTIGVYSVPNGSVSWLGGGITNIRSHKIDGVKIMEPIPAAILMNQSTSKR